MSSFLAEFGQELLPPFPEGGQPGAELPQLAVDLFQFGPGLLFPQVALASGGQRPHDFPPRAASNGIWRALAAMRSAPYARDIIAINE